MLDSIPKEYAYEIIVCDDGSIDRTVEILEKYQQSCPQLKILKNEQNKGASYSYNRCIEEATGDYIAIIDSDDMYLPTIRDVLAQVDGTYDIYYYNMLTKIGQRFVKSETDGYSWCGQFKIIRRSFIGDAKFTTRPDIAGDYDFNKTLVDQKPTCKYTGIFAYWYNYPRVNSEYYLFQHGLKQEKKAKKIALISRDGDPLGDQYIFKDVCLVPILLAEYLGYDVLITTEINRDKLKETFPNINFEFVTFQENYEMNMIQYLQDHATEINIAFVFGPYMPYLKLLETYKKNNPNGKTYLKMDMNRYWLNRLIVNHHNFLSQLFQYCDFVSAECSPIVKTLADHFQKEFHHIQNGYYEFFPTEEVSYEEKKNIILTVGRLDAPVKQIMMAVNAFLNAELPDWELRLIGTMSEEFEKQFMEVVSASPYGNQVKFLGPIVDKNKLEQEYRQAKIFCLTSHTEAHAHVLAEAAKNGCYLMLTDVDGAIDMTNNERWGKIHPIYNWNIFSESLKEVTKQEELFKTTCVEIQQYARANLNWAQIIPKIARMLGEERAETK